MLPTQGGWSNSKPCSNLDFFKLDFESRASMDITGKYSVTELHPQQTPKLLLNEKRISNSI